MIDLNKPNDDIVDDLNLTFAKAEYQNKKFFNIDNPDFYINEFSYNKEEGKFYFKTSVNEECCNFADSIS